MFSGCLRKNRLSAAKTFFDLSDVFRLILFCSVQDISVRITEKDIVLLCPSQTVCQMLRFDPCTKIYPFDLLHPNQVVVFSQSDRKPFVSALRFFKILRQFFRLVFDLRMILLRREGSFYSGKQIFPAVIKKNPVQILIFFYFRFKLILFSHQCQIPFQPIGRSYDHFQVPIRLTLNGKHIFNIRQRVFNGLHIYFQGTSIGLLPEYFL